jgi:4'-phosphopantetheinyl transferase
VFKKDRVKFIVARAFLRVLLGRYLHRLPGAIRFTYGENGKPGLPAHASDGPFGFNIAHAGDWIVCAVAPSNHVGVDIECPPGGLDVLSLGDSILSDGEQEALRSLPIGERITSFLACWTRKEAYLKSMGLGLQVPLDSFEVSVRPSERPRIVSIDGRQDRAEHWFMEEFAPTQGYAGAVVAPGKDWNVVYLNFAIESRAVHETISVRA